MIPADARGPVDILLESSTNFVDWVQARYFRVRAVRK